MAFLADDEAVLLRPSRPDSRRAGDRRGARPRTRRGAAAQGTVREHRRRRAFGHRLPSTKLNNSRTAVDAA